MELNNDYSFLADTQRYSAVYAIQYAIEKNDIKCWEVVLMRPDIPDQECFDLARELENTKLYITVLKRPMLKASVVVDTVAYMFDEDACWVEIFQIYDVIKYLTMLRKNEILEKYSSVKSTVFRNKMLELNPALKKEKCFA